MGWRRDEGESNRGDFGEARAYARDTRSSPLAFHPLPLKIAPGTLIPFNQTPAGSVTVVSLFIIRCGKNEGERLCLSKHCLERKGTTLLNLIIRIANLSFEKYESTRTQNFCDISHDNIFFTDTDKKLI